MSFVSDFRSVRKIVKSTVSFVMYVLRPHATTGLSLGGFAWTLIFKHFSNICQEK